MPKKQIERVWLLGVVVVGALLVLIGYTMFVSPQNSKTSGARSQVSNADAANQRLQLRINGLREQSKNLSKYQADLTAAQLALPATSGLPDFLRTLQSIGNATLTSVSSLTVGPPTDVTPIAGTAAANRVSSSSTSTTSPTSASTGSASIYALPISASVTGSTNALDAFLVQLQTVQPRAVLISELSESSGQTSSGTAGGQANSASGSTTLTLTMQAFVEPASAAEQARLATAAGK
jgi:Tfp pilus assembly protein PilO